MVLGAIPAVLVSFPEAYKISVPPVLALITLPIVLVAAVLFLMQAIKRCHDLDWSGWCSVFLLVPIVGFVFFLYLTFTKGTDGPNRFGPDPLREEMAT